MILHFIISGRLKKAEFLTQEIQQVFTEYKLEFFHTNKSNSADIVISRIINKHNAKHIIIVGGDGTINECINGIMQTNSNNHNKIYLGIIPMGTGNDFAKSLKINNSLTKLLYYINTNRFNRIDIGKMNYINHSNNKAIRYFINIADIGIGALVVKKINESSRKFMPSTIYFRAIISSFFSFKRSVVKFTSSNFNWKGEVLSLCIANGKYFGDGLCIAPDASPNSGKLNIVILGKLNIVDYLLQMGKVKKCTKLTLKEAIYSEVESCTITSIKDKTPIEMDGEFIGYTPIYVNVLPHYLNIYSEL